MLNMIALWNTIYMEAALSQLREEGYPEEVIEAVLSLPLIITAILIVTAPELVPLVFGDALSSFSDALLGGTQFAAASWSSSRPQSDDAGVHSTGLRVRAASAVSASPDVSAAPAMRISRPCTR